MIAAEIDLTIPDFLVVDKAEGARRKAWNEAHPVVHTNFSGQTEVEERAVDEARARMKAEKLVRETERLNALHARKVEERRAEGHGGFSEPLKGMIWNPLRGKWVLPNYMSPRKYARLLSEMPTEGHRKIFVKLYGSGLGVSLGAGGSPACATKDATTVESTPAGASGKSRSAVKGAERVRVPSEPRGGAVAANRRVKAPPTLKPAAPRAAGDWMPRVITLLSRPEGATLAEVGAQEGWLEHSASARLSAIRKERAIIAAVEDRGRVYRMEKAA